MPVLFQVSCEAWKQTQIRGALALKELTTHWMTEAQVAITQHDVWNPGPAVQLTLPDSDFF